MEERSSRGGTPGGGRHLTKIREVRVSLLDLVVKQVRDEDQLSPVVDRGPVWSLFGSSSHRVGPQGPGGPDPRSSVLKRARGLDSWTLTESSTPQDRSRPQTQQDQQLVLVLVRLTVTRNPIKLRR